LLFFHLILSWFVNLFCYCKLYITAVSFYFSEKCCLSPDLSTRAHLADRFCTRAPKWPHPQLLCWCAIESIFRDTAAPAIHTHLNDCDAFYLVQLFIGVGYDLHIYMYFSRCHISIIYFIFIPFLQKNILAERKKVLRYKWYQKSVLSLSA